MGPKDIVFFSKKFFNVEEIPYVLADKHLAIIGNRRTEATKYMIPVKMMEYMASGIPVIAPKLNNISHYFSNKQICFYEPENVNDLANKIIFLYAHPEIRESLSKKAYEFIKENNWEREERKYFKVLGIK